MVKQDADPHLVVFFNFVFSLSFAELSILIVVFSREHYEPSASNVMYVDKYLNVARNADFPLIN